MMMQLTEHPSGTDKWAEGKAVDCVFSKHREWLLACNGKPLMPPKWSIIADRSATSLSII